jgi:hypothetical protein
MSLWYGDGSEERIACPYCGYDRETPIGTTRELLRKGEEVEP